MTLYDRLVAALLKHPEEEYLLWQRMRDLRYHLPWQEDSWFRWTLMSVDGEEAASVTLEGHVWRWDACGETGEDVLEHAKAKADALLWVNGWRPVPTTTPKPAHEEEEWREAATGDWWKTVAGGVLTVKRVGKRWVWQVRGGGSHDVEDAKRVAEANAVTLGVATHRPKGDA